MNNILLIDDHFILRKGLRLAIENFLPHCRIDDAEDGDSAMEKFKKNDYDLIFLDINMPHTDSFGLISTFLVFKPETKIIMFSMNSEESYAKRFLKLGAKGYLKKNAPETEIRIAIETVLNNKIYLSPILSEKLINEFMANPSVENPFDSLSPREFEIAQHLALGESVTEISRILNLGTSTIGTHKANALKKLQCSNTIELNKLAKLNNVIQD